MRQMTSAHAYDVIVIGAGLSGLSAARAIHRAGKSLLVLEARDRVGGKTCSVDTSTGGRVDLGAAWVNEHLMPRISGLALESGNELITQYTAGDGGLPSAAQGSPWDPEDLANFIKINKLFIALCADLPTSHSAAAQHERIRRYDGLTVSAWLDMPDVLARPRIKDLLRPGVHALLGVEMEELSMAYLMHYAATAGGWTALISNEADGAQYQRTRDGTQGISIFLASHLPKGSVRLDSPVHSIHQGERTVEITTRSGESFFGKQIILTIPSPLYETIRFSPPLPPSTQGVLAQRAFLGVLGKCIAIYSEPWWRGKGWKGTWQSSEGPISMIFDTCDGYPEGDGDSQTEGAGSGEVGADGQGKDRGKGKGPIARQYSLTCFIASHHAIDYFALPAEKRADAVVNQLARLFHFTSSYSTSPSFSSASGGERPPLPVQLLDHLWTDEEFSRGAPCPVLPTGVLSGYGKYYGKRHERVWFAGTEYSDVWKGYMEGAVHSGQTAAEEVLAVL